MRDWTYPSIIRTCLIGFKALGQRFQMTGTDNVPRSGGVLLVSNHVGYLDFIYAGLGGWPSRRLVRFMAKREVFDNAIGGPVMRSMHHISVDRGDGIESFNEAVRYLKSGEAVGIFPEATISRAMELKEFKTGAVRIAAEAGVPIVPVILFGTQRMYTKDHPKDFRRGKTIAITVGEPFHVTGEDAVAETARLKEVMNTMLEQTVAAYPAAERPDGAWWVPARLGGSAPTLEQAAVMDTEEKAERARRKAAKAAAKQQDA
jgi:1-acyl-sn-glycerol-3-phosphate acyltransferase